MSHYKPYPAYRDSGVEWLARVPKHWKVGNIRRFAQMKTGHTPSRSEPSYWQSCDIPWFTLADVWQLRNERQKFLGDTNEQISLLGLENSAAELLPAGTVVFSRTASIGFSGVMPVPMATSQDFWNWIPCPELLSEYLLYTFRSMRQEFARLTMGSTHKTIYQPDAAGLQICVPPIEEQRKVVECLDRETARIDALIEKKTRFIELLREKRQALITHAVTKGLDPNVKMKDSGLEWLGEVPEHWDVAPMKYVCELLKDGTHLPPPRTDEGVPLLSVRNIIDGHFTLRDDDSTISHQDYMELCKAFIPQEGDVLLAVVGATLGKTALIPAALGQFHIQRSLAIFRPHHGRMNSRWLHLIFQSSLFQSLLWEHAGYSAQPGIYLGTLAGFSIPQPPLNEQAQISSYLSERTARLDSLIRTTESSIELLKERRSALITAAVTGQIDLREAV
ncbi:restriction endonuclease subunit S [Pseudomonas sp. MAHUQ-62]|uniref:restriction endonuclease subunit S n=1 Tax=Pseudomonas sp. GCM10023245 TaxID=3252652 RepID=UPI00360A690C